MDNQHRKIAGYRELSQTEIDLMNDLKKFERDVIRLKVRIDAHLAQQADSDPDAGARWLYADPWGWLIRGVGSMQDGVMQMTRAIAQPVNHPDLHGDEKEAEQ